jgi:SWI/SNF-related matrix-associated actin-dependent regulator 1 of chromatin subfamily A
MAKKQSDSQKNAVNIRKLKTNYELRYDFNKMLSEYIKSLPKEHRSTRKDSVINADGVEKDDWVRTVRENAMGNVVNFMVDNGIPFAFQNVSEDDINKLRKEYSDRQKRLAEILKLKAESLDISEEDYSFLKRKPYNYQKQAVKFFEINDGKAILGDQPGVGKTLSAISYAVKHQHKTLVICPSSLKLNWRKEIDDFTNEKAFVYKYMPKKRSKDVAYKKDESLFHVINYESLDSYVKIEYKHKCKGKMVRTAGNGMVECGCEIINLNKTQVECPQCKNKKTFKSTFHSLQYFEDGFGEYLNPEDYDLIVIDESHRIKEKKTGWTQIIVRAFRDTVPRKILISGTAIKSRPSEFFTSLNFLNKDEWNNQHEFGVKYCAGYDTGFGWDYSGVSNLEQLFTRISGVFLRRLKKDVLQDLPPKTYTNMPIELTDAEYKEYEQILKSFKKEDENGKSVEESYLAKIAKLKLFTGRCKLKRAIDYIQDIIDGGEKVVIMSDLQELAEEVHKLFPKISVLHTGSMNENDKFESYQNFQKNKDIKVFSGMIMASGVGISLTEASRLIFLGFGWTPGDMMQAEDRIHRASTTHDNIQIITLYCTGTIDEDIMELLDEKDQVVTMVLDNQKVDKKIHTGDYSMLKALIEKIKSQ